MMVMHTACCTMPHAARAARRRQQLKALVDIHGEERGLGGKLSADETKVITGVWCKAVLGWHPGHHRCAV